MPRGTAACWGRTLALGWLATAALMLALVWIARATIGDESALFHQLLGHVPLSFHASIWAETPGNSIFLIPVVAVSAIVAVRHGRPLRALSLLAAFALIDTIVLLGWLSWDRPRPTLVLDGIAAPGFKSFPSGHVAQTIAVYGLLCAFWIEAATQRIERICAVLLCAVLVIVVGLARLVLGTHWPSDLLAGAVVGAAWLGAIVVALRRAEAHAADRSGVEPANARRPELHSP